MGIPFKGRKLNWGRSQSLVFPAGLTTLLERGLIELELEEATPLQVTLCWPNFNPFPGAGFSAEMTELTPNRIAISRAIVEVGLAGTSYRFACDWSQGMQFCVAAESLKVDASLTVIGDGVLIGTSIRIGAVAAKGEYGRPSRATLTSVHLIVAPGNGVILAIPPFAKELTILRNDETVPVRVEFFTNTAVATVFAQRTFPAGGDATPVQIPGCCDSFRFVNLAGAGAVAVNAIWNLAI